MGWGGRGDLGRRRWPLDDGGFTDLVFESSVSDRHPRLLGLLSFQACVLGTLATSGQQRIRDNIVDDTSAGVGIVAKRDDMFDDCIVVDESHALLLMDPLADTIELETNDAASISFDRG